MAGVSLATALRSTGDTRTIITGTVVSASSTTHTAVVDLDGQGTRVTVPFVGATPTAGNVAVLARSNHRLWMLGVYGASVSVPSVPDVPVTPPPPTVTTLTLRPTATGSTRPGSVTAPSGDSLVQGDWAGYGPAFGQAVYRSPIWAGNTTRSCTVQIRRTTGGVNAGQSATLHRMPNDSIVTSPTSQASMPLPALAVGQSATVTLPNDWGDALLTGASRALGIYVPGSSPYVRLDGLSTWGPSFTVTITYQEG